MAEIGKPWRPSFHGSLWKVRNGLHEGQEQREATQREPPAPSGQNAAVGADAMSLQAPLGC